MSNTYLHLTCATARFQQYPKGHRENPEYCQALLPGIPAPANRPGSAHDEYSTNYQLCLSEPTLICLLSCVGNFSSSTSLTAALPRNKSMVIPGGSKPWCCCHFNACGNKKHRDLLSCTKEPSLLLRQTVPERTRSRKRSPVSTVSDYPNIISRSVCHRTWTFHDSDRQKLYLTPIFLYYKQKL